MRRFLLVPVLCLLAGVASAADSQLLKLVMPDARVVSGIDFDRVRTTPFGLFMLSQLPEGDAGFREFISVTGFDPRLDIHEIVMASPADVTRKSGLLLVRGNFDSQRLLSLFRADGKQIDTYNGVGLISAGKGHHGIGEAIAFLDNSTAAAGDIASVRTAIDRRAGARGMESALLDKITRTSLNQDAWVVSIAPVSAFAPVMPDKNIKGALQGDLIKAIEQSTGSIRFGKTIEISGELTARTDKDAASLADVVKFFLNMAQMNAPGGQLGQLANLLQSLTVNTEANAVKLFVAIPENDFENLIRASSRAARSRI
ncbi:MAG TPA: hypothetical protein VL285_20555 [Bryobacteraceae bacterium]|jgi:hypothetical protein|nr:hypothetical protein [Bryobacteraceae bacterium]